MSRAYDTLCRAWRSRAARSSQSRLLGGSSPSAESQETATIERLAARAVALEHDIARLEDEKAIEKLQRIYGFYTDKQLWSQAADLFAANGTIEVGRARRLRRQGARARVLEAQRAGVSAGRAVVRSNAAAADRACRARRSHREEPLAHVRARGRARRLRALGPRRVRERVRARRAASGRSSHFISTRRCTRRTRMVGRRPRLPNEGPSSALPPDRPPSVDYKAFPAAYVVPFHYENPVPAHSRRLPRWVQTAAEAQALDGGRRRRHSLVRSTTSSTRASIGSAYSRTSRSSSA